jgi:glycosyltransferase involved in cell wall biosynthesis
MHRIEGKRGLSHGPAGGVPSIAGRVVRPYRRPYRNPEAAASAAPPFGDIESPMPSSLTILLPALNEERGIVKVLRSIPRRRLERLGLTCDVYLLDGHSTDRTRSLAWKMGAQVIVQNGKGKGAAVREFLPEIWTDVTIFLDSDGTYPAEMIPQFVDGLRRAPVVLGSRLRGSGMDDGAMNLLNRVGNRLISAFASFLFGVPVSDVCSGMWAFDSALLKSLDLTADGFDLEVDLFAECALRRIPIVEVAIPYRRRLGKGKLRLREGFRIALALLEKRLRSRRTSPKGVRTHMGARLDAAEAADGANWGP